MSQNFYNPTFRLFTVSSKFCQLNDHLMSRYCSHRVLNRNKNILMESGIVRHDKSKRPTRFIRSDNPCFSMLYHRNNRSLSSLSTGICCNFHLHDIVMYRSAALILCDKYILIVTLYTHKTKTACITLKYTGHNTRLRLCIFSLFGHLDFTVFYQRIQYRLQFCATGFRDIQ